MRVTSISSLKKIKNRGLKSLFPSKIRLSVGLGSCGIAAGAESVYNALKKEAAKRKLDVVITKTGCFGFCGEEPLVNLMKPRSPLVVYHRFNEEDAKEIITQLAAKKIYEKKVFCKIEEMENLRSPNY